MIVKIPISVIQPFEPYGFPTPQYNHALGAILEDAINQIMEQGSAPAISQAQVRFEELVRSMKEYSQ
jgi:hypothetical protein